MNSMYLLTRKEMCLLDELSIKKYKIPSKRLMENAGRAVFKVIQKKMKGGIQGKTFLVFCGPGNNGGDGLVIARLLEKSGGKVVVINLANQKKLKEIKSDLIIDAIFGTGLTRPVTGFYRKTIHWINGQKTPKISVDIPSGLNADSGKPMGISVKANWTVTFQFPKRGFFFHQAASFVGELHVVSIGLASQAIKTIDPKTHLITSDEFTKILQPRAKNSHKGSFGHIFIIACSEGKIGAGIMAAYSALKVGGGLSTLILPESAYKKINSQSLEIMYEPIFDQSRGFFTKKEAPLVLKKIKEASVVAIGPGLGDHPQTNQFIWEIIQKFNGPLIIDADGLNALAKKSFLLKKRKGLTLLTPHPGEMGRLIGKTISYVQNHRLEIVSSFAKKQGVYLLLKGYRSILATPHKNVWINPTGNPAMASAGQGDVLTGIYAGLLAQYPVEAQLIAPLLLGCFLHGLVGDILAKKGNRVVMAMDIAKNINLGFKFLNKKTNFLRTEFV